MTPPAPSSLVGSARHEAVMFWLAVACLFGIAGLIHRAVTPGVSDDEVWTMSCVLLVLEPIFLLEAFVGVFRATRERRRVVLLRALLIAMFPPYRIGRTHPQSGLAWFPRLGWVPISKDTFDRIDRGFSTPMLFVAILILPVLILEYTQADLVKANPGLSLALDLGVAVIWVAFALEFLLESSVAPKAGKYLKEKWLDAAIVILPMLEFVLTRLVDAAPLARLLRLGRALSPEQLARMQKLYRLRGLMMKTWAAFLLLGGMQRLFGPSPEKRLKQVEEKIVELEAELIELRQEAEKLRRTIVTEDGTPTESGESKANNHIIL